MYSIFRSTLFALLVTASASANVVFNEIMYHPATELTSEEYIELYNNGAASVDLSGWKITSGVNYTFPAGTSIAAGAYLVVTASPAVFHAKYPAVANYIASSGWQTVVAGLVQPNGGILSNSADHIVMVNAAGIAINDVSYADDGDWGVRRRDYFADGGHRGWTWDSPADGGTNPTPEFQNAAITDSYAKSKSMELVNPLFSNSSGQNWQASTVVNGTPGAMNSVFASNIAPEITKVTHFPLLPTHTDAVVITAKVTNDDVSVPTATLHWRVCATVSPYTDAAFTTAAMFDDGAHGDALAGDGVYGATIPAQANGAMVEFYLDVVDAGSHARTWPAPALDVVLNGSFVVTGLVSVQSQNCLYQVDDTVYAAAQPIYRMVMKPADKVELVQINAATPAAPYPYGPTESTDQSYSHANFNTTWTSVDGTGSEMHYLTGVRNRGHGSRKNPPQNFNIAFANDDKWKNRTSLNLNTRYTFSQLFGSALYRKAGLAGPESRAVQVRWNAVNALTAVPGTSFGFYVANEVQNSDFSAHHYPLDSSGNIYRAARYDFTVPTNTMAEADLTYKAPTGTQTAADPYRTVWFKHTNSSEDDWSDLITLTQTLGKGHSAADFSTTYDADYQTAVEAKVDVEQWMRFFAVQTIVDNSETNISNGYGDDFYLYIGKTDLRAEFVPYDLDTICGQGDAVPATATTNGLFRMVNKDDAVGSGPAVVMNSFMKFPAFAPIYYKHLHELLTGPFVTANFNALVDESLNSAGTGVDLTTQIASIKARQAVRTPYLTTLVPLAIAVTTGPTGASGYPHTTTATTSLVGVANSITTRSVKVNGVAATWSAWQAQWTASSVALVPGINTVLIQAFDGSNVETERATYDVWYDDASVASVSGAIAANTTWTAATGPYLVTANLTVNSGVTLTISPGTTVYLASGVNIIVASGGKLLAEGTETLPIRFSRTPGAATSWGNLQINGAAGTPETRVAYAHFEFNGGSPAILCTGATVFLDHLTFGNTAVSYIHLDSSGFVVSNCNFPTPTGNFEPVHGTGGVKAGGIGVIRDNYFGQPNLFNDTIDFTGGNRPSPVFQVIGNIFNGASDDCLDLDSTDAWIEGNVFMHVHRDPARTDDARDTGSAISGGTDTAGVYNEWTIINNLFYDVDHAVMTKQGGRVAFLYNTVSHVAKEAGAGTDISAFNWTDNGIALPASTLGSGAYLAHNIINDCPLLQANYNVANHTVIMDNNLLSETWSGPGSGNQVVNPRLNLSVLNGIPVASVTPAQVRQAFQLLTGSPAIGTGFGGRNIGGLSAHGIAISGEPIGTTSSTSATLTVGLGGTINWGTIPVFPWGWTAYKWKLDGGAYSAEIPVTNNSPFTSLPTISLTGLANGTHTVTVIGKSDVGYYQDDTVIYPANSNTPAAASVSKTWTVNTAYVPPAATANVVINEVLAKNTETIGFTGVFPDIIELRNTGTASADISGWGLTDNAAIPYKYVIPASTTLAPGAYFVIYADSAASVPAPKTGFGLKQSGDTLTLTKSVVAGGGVADAVPFGAQLADVSIGRRPSDGLWDMCVPTFGAANIVAAQATPTSLLINEWLADARALFSTDFIEIFNPNTLPVNIGGCYLTNNPVEYANQSQLRQLTFVSHSGYAVFKADGDTAQGADHLAFKLSPQQGEIGFFDASLGLIDNVVYGPQSTDVSQGRTPNGTTTIAYFTQPTPGGPNPGASGGGGSTVTTSNLISTTKLWSYFQSATAAPAADASSRPFTAAAYTETGWLSAAGLFYIEESALASASGFAKTTVLTGFTPTAGTPSSGFYPYQTYYYRTHFTYSGPLTGVTLSATIMLDDGAVIYLNGVEATRLRMPTGTPTYATISNTNVGNAVEETISIPTTSLVVGDNVIAAEVHQSSTQSAAAGSSDVVWGLKLDATITVAGAVNPIVLNEILPINATLQNPAGDFGGWVELYNTSATSAYDVSDMSLTRDAADAREWVIPAGTTAIPAGGYLVLYCNPLAAATTVTGANMNTAFPLSGSGDRIYLFDKLASGGALQDSVVFGQQLPDFSIGRITNGTGAFALNVPTRGALNTAAATVGIANAKINEWLALPPLGASWLELYNTTATPVLLSGNYLTDNLTVKNKFLLPPLTFLGGTSATRWLQLIADNDSSGTPNHVNFTLNPAGEAIGIFSASGVQLESVSFGVQAAGISGGRLADGTVTILALNPTPGTANQSLSTDTDADGIPDWWEKLYGMNFNSAADAALDSDGDGQTNLQEYLAGTNPLQNGSKLAAAVATTGTAGQFAISFTAIAGKTYTVRYKASLTDATWTNLQQIAAPASDTFTTVNDTPPANTPKRFYQVVTPQQP